MPPMKKVVLAAAAALALTIAVVPLVLAQQNAPEQNPPDPDPPTKPDGETRFYFDPDGNGAYSPYTREEAMAEGLIVETDPMEMFKRARQDPPKRKTERWIGEAGLPVEERPNGDRVIVTQQVGDHQSIINCDQAFWAIGKDSSRLQPGQYQREKGVAERCIENGVHPPEANPGVRKLPDEMTIEPK